MSTRLSVRILAAAAILLLLPVAAPAQSGLGKAERICAAAKLKATGKKAHAKLNCEAKAILKELSETDPECLAKVEAKFGNAFEKAELKGGCISDGDAALVESSVDTFVTGETARQLSGQSLPTCTSPMAECGSCGTGSCLPSTTGTFCVNAATSIVPCPVEGCPVGMVCLDVPLAGTSVCAIGCP